MPGVVVLDEVRAMIASTHPDQQQIAIDHCKFQSFVLPDQPFRMVVTTATDVTIDFICTSADDGRLLVKGRFRLEPAGIG